MLKQKFLIISVLACFLILTSSNAKSKEYSEEELGVRKSNLYNEELKLKNNLNYSEDAPGSSKLIERSFENAPPLISHSVEGLLPITKDYNSCLGCHAPEIAVDINATPVPKTHLVSYRPIIDYKNGILTKDGQKYVNTYEIKTIAHQRMGVSSDRYNCSQCHVPQTNNKPLVANNFKAEFRKKESGKKSNLADILNEGVSYE